ncbi:hypothetical protein WJX72_009513 [[Myrmecia] bisecta]|uniref:Cilia- and flagella-associated protein 91 n=1 Tax=[Myrmecia] bisecta TaxID=41462 RepID=A0AAW1Q4M3_9CHLO
MQGSRPYDALFDTTYTVSGVRDHYRSQTQAGGIKLERVPQFDNFFSELAHHPAQSFRFKAADKLPQHVPRDFQPQYVTKEDLLQRSLPQAVSGPHRYRYTKRPLYNPAARKALAENSHGALSHASQASFAAPAPPKPASRTVGTQSDYRENETQTTPFAPDYALPDQPSAKQQHLSQRYNCAGPELLTLQEMSFASGTHVGLAQVEAVDKRRLKRAFEASLPPLNDLEMLPVRKRMLDEWEAGEWEEREQEIVQEQDERLVRLKAKLSDREQQIERSNAERIAALRERRSSEKARKLAYLHKQRVSAIRHISEARKYLEKPAKVTKTTAVERYGDYASSVYAPFQREGRFPDSHPKGQNINTDPFQPATLHAVLDLEASLPRRALQPRIRTAKPAASLTYEQRKELQVTRDLQHISDLLASAKGATGRGSGDCWPCQVEEGQAAPAKLKAKRAALVTERPDTPSAPMPSSSAARDAAAVLLQRLLRGRAMQNQMFEGKEARLALIRELQLEEDGVGQCARPEAVAEELRAADALVGSAVMEMVRVLAEQDPGVQADMMRALQQRRRQECGTPEEATTSTSTSNITTSACEAAAIASSAARSSQSAQAADEGAAMAASGPLFGSPEQHRAAVRIQAVQRGRLARQQVEDLRGLQKALERFSPDDVERLVKLQSLQRGRTARRQAASEKEKVVRIQALHRGRMARKQVGEMRDEINPSRTGLDQGRKDAEAALVQLDPGVVRSGSRAAEDDQIVLIQAAIRGHLARKEVAAMRNNTTAGSNA